MKKRIQIKALLLSAGITASLITPLPAFAVEDIPDESAADSAFTDDAVYSDSADSDSYTNADTDIYTDTYTDSYSDSYTESGSDAETTSGGDEAPEEETSSPDNTQISASWPQGPELSSESALLLEDETGTILFSKNPSMSVQTGSPVKIMTALVALENSSLTDSVTVTATGASGVSDSSANISLSEGEVLTMEDCLHGILLASANDAALQVAEQVSGSVDAFVEQMNQKAAALGCTNTTFTNPTGLPDENQVTTAHDLALITKAALDNENFRKISSAAEYTIPATDYHEARTLTNNFSLLQPEGESYYDGCIGGKEGYTQESLSTLACGAARQDTTLIAIVLKGEDTVTDSEAAALLDFGFDSFQKVKKEEGPQVLEGGTAVIPSSASVDDIQVVSSEKSDGTHQEYYFENTLVGTGLIQAVIQTESQTGNTIIESDGLANRQAAEDLTINKSMTPYYIIGGVTGLLFLLLLIWLVKIIKS